MDGFKGQGGVHMLLTREEADREIAQYRASLEAEYQKSVSETSGNSGMNVKRLEEETVEKIKSLKDMSSKVSKDVVAMLMRQVTIKLKLRMFPGIS
ncbi:hypothetical protein MKW92_044200 [Papaver armeniacum]|nr:hypothetical protein MKW92_044200 [Papaver armeniacum]